MRPDAEHPECNARLDVTSRPDWLEEAVRLVAIHFDGERGEFAYRAFDYINAEYFGGELPTPLIVWVITPHGGCLALTRVSKSSPPRIRLHPSLLGGTEKVNPWGYSPEVLGEALVMDVLLHECIHVSVDYRLGGAKGPTSHNNPQWLGEVARIAPLLGLDDLVVGRSRLKRIREEDGTSRVQRACDGNVPYRVLAGFPSALRFHRGQAGHYRRNVLPWNRGNR